MLLRSARTLARGSCETLPGNPNPALPCSDFEMPGQKSFPFMDLPPELRNRIYELVLTMKLTLRLVHRQKFNKKVNQGMMKVPGLITFAQRSKMRKAVKILLVNRQINSEATPFLYGGNKFMFDSFNTLKNFLGLIPDAREFLTYITVEGKYALLTAESVFNFLVQAKRLKRLQLATLDDFDAGNPLQAYKTFKPFLDSLAKIRRKPLAFLDVIKSGDYTAMMGDRRWTKTEQQEFWDEISRLLVQSMRPRNAKSIVVDEAKRIEEDDEVA